MASSLGYVGFLISVLGILIEGLAVCAMVSHPLRRRLPWSPYSILAVGFACFIGGMVLFAAMRAP